MIFEIVPDTNTAEMLLREHQIDMISASQMNWPRFAALAADPRNGLVASCVEQFEWTHVDFNLGRPIVADRDGARGTRICDGRQEIIGKLYTGYQSRRKPIKAPGSRGPTPTTSPTIRTIRQRARAFWTRKAGRSDPTAFA